MGRIEYTQGPGRWGQLISQHNSDTGQSHYYGFDHMSNTRFLSDSGGSITDSYSYKAFGEEMAATGSTPNPMRYGGNVGYYRDKIERVYIRARNYEPLTGRWLSPDPIGFEAGDWNLYRYVENAPIILRDPSGLESRGVCFRRTYSNLRGRGVSPAGACQRAKGLCQSGVNCSNPMFYTPPLPLPPRRCGIEFDTCVKAAADNMYSCMVGWIRFNCGGPSFISIAASYAVLGCFSGIFTGAIIGEIAFPPGGAVPGAIIGCLAGAGITVAYTSGLARDLYGCYMDGWGDIYGCLWTLAECEYDKLS